MRSVPKVSPTLLPTIHPDLVPEIPRSILESDHGQHGRPSTETITLTSLKIAEELAQEADTEATSRLERAMTASRHAINSSKLAEKMLQAALDLFNHQQGDQQQPQPPQQQHNSRRQPLNKLHLPEMMPLQIPFSSATTSTTVTSAGPRTQTTTDDGHSTTATLVSRCNLTGQDPALVLSQFAMLANSATDGQVSTAMQQQQQGGPRSIASKRRKTNTGRPETTAGAMPPPDAAPFRQPPLLDPTIAERVQENTEAIFRQTMRVCQASKDADRKANEAIQRSFLAHHQAEHLRQASFSGPLLLTIPTTMQLSQPSSTVSLAPRTKSFSS